MLTTPQDHGMFLDTGNSGVVWAVAFSPDGEHLLSGSPDGIRRFQLADQQETAKRTGMSVMAISISRDGRRIVCGTFDGASVLDGELQEIVCDVEGGKQVIAVDVSPDSTQIATGTYEETASVWNIKTGERLLGPLEFNITGIRFSPTGGDRIAISEYAGPITISDSRTGDKLVIIDTQTRTWFPIIPLAWSNDAQRIFAVSKDGDKVMSFDVSTGSLLAELQVTDIGDLLSIALAANGKLIAAQAGSSISFLDASTLARIGPIIKMGVRMRSIALSRNSSHLATGQEADGKIRIHNLSTVLPDILGSISAAAVEPERAGDTDKNKFPNSDASSSRHDSGPDNRDGDIDPSEVPSSTAAPAVDYDPPLSLACSQAVRPSVGDVLPSVEVSHPIVIPPSSPLPVTSPPDVHPEERPDIAASKSRPVLVGWPKKLRRTAEDQASRNNEHCPTIMTENRRRRRMPVVYALPEEERSHLFTYFSRRRQRQRPTARTPIIHGPSEDKSRTGHVQGSAEPSQAAPAPPANDASRPSSGAAWVRTTNQSPRDRMTIGLPTWLICFRPCSVDVAD
ncbi:WD40-repeat-containing domain protein [Chiua virens]|nr:WD40-repeat-containing domain protein [Chiua virens]